MFAFFIISAKKSAMTLEKISVSAKQNVCDAFELFSTASPIGLIREQTQQQLYRVMLYLIACNGRISH
jgi:hypothetical protein